MDELIEKIIDRILSRIDSLMSMTADEEMIERLLDKAIRLLGLYITIKGGSNHEIDH